MKFQESPIVCTLSIGNSLAQGVEGGVRKSAIVLWKTLWKTLSKWMIWGYHYFWKHPCHQ